MLNINDYDGPAELHKWDVNVNGIDYSVTIAAQDNISLDSHIVCHGDLENYPYDETTLLSFLYECASVEGDTREYNEYQITWENGSRNWIKPKVTMKCLSFKLEEAE